MRGNLMYFRYQHVTDGDKEMVINLDHVMSITHDYDNAHVLHYTNGEKLILSEESFRTIIKKLFD